MVGRERDDSGSDVLHIAAPTDRRLPRELTENRFLFAIANQRVEDWRFNEGIDVFGRAGLDARPVISASLALGNVQGFALC